MTSREIKRAYSAAYCIRLVCSVLSAAILLSNLILFALIADSPDDWPVFRGSPSLTGNTRSVLPKAPKLRWSFQAKDSIESSAAIVGTTVYAGSMDGSLYAINLSTGKLAWQYPATGPIQESSPCVCNGVVYVGDLNGVLHAVDAATGKPRWTYKTEGEIRSSPNCVGNHVFFGSYDQNVYCLSAGAGTLVWKFTAEGPIHCTPAIYKGRVFVSGCDEHLRVIEAATGKQIFAFPLGAYAGASAAVSDETAYVGTFGNEVLSLELRRQVVQWTYRHPSRNFPFYSSAAVAGDRILIGGRDKIVHCLDRLTGREIWSFATRSRVESSPLVTENRVFIGSNDGVLYELDLSSGKKVWDFTAGAPLSASPAVARGSLVIGSQDGTLYCFGN